MCLEFNILKIFPMAYVVDNLCLTGIWKWGSVVVLLPMYGVVATVFMCVMDMALVSFCDFCNHALGMIMSLCILTVLVNNDKGYLMYVLFYFLI